MATKKVNKRSELEHQYEELFLIKRLPNLEHLDQNRSLEQPSPLRVVKTVVTYGAYEKPI